MEKKYSVAIRTLGTAGEKYQRLLDSLKAQTVPAKDIFVYIPNGYDLPKETIGIEKYIRCEKGMITQRSLSFDEITTDYVLFCDDDLFLPSNFVERMFEGLESMNGDCIAADVYSEDKMSRMKQLAIFLHSFITPRKDDGWMVKIKRNVSYSYNSSPKKDFLRTESAPGGSCLCKMSTYKAIHFDDERWLENMKYPAGEDQLFYYKMHIMGYKVMQYLNTGVLHLDAQAGHKIVKSNKMYLQKKNMFAMWYRTIYNIKSKGRFEKLRCAAAFSWRCLFGIFTLPLEVIHYKQPRFFVDYFRGLWAGFQYVRSNEYKRIPTYDSYVRH